jgi:hypothetical protein
MRYAVKYTDDTLGDLDGAAEHFAVMPPHPSGGDWLVFDVDGFELVGVHADEQDAIDHAMKLEERSRRFPPLE